MVAPGFIDLHQHAQTAEGYRVEALDGTTSALELEDTPRMLDLIRGARARGLDVTTECYPYDASMTSIRTGTDSAWRAKPDAWFARFEWRATGDRLTRESFPRFRAVGGNVVIHNNTEPIVRAAVADPLTMIASDGMLHYGIGHPRVAGTYARVLGRYVRVGADADLVLFDPRTVADRATYREPTRPPVGMPYVFVNGTIVVRNGRIVDGVLPGRAIRAPVAAGPSRSSPHP